MATALIGLATVFVFVCGANDGGALLALALRQREAGSVVMIGMLLAAIVAGPALFGLAVARTFTDRLVTTQERGGQLVVALGVLVAVLLVLGFTWRGVPTSVTLAVVGALGGAGLGLGSAPSWTALGQMLAIGAAAPLVGGGLGYLVGRLARRAPTTGRLPSALRLAQIAAYGGQCLAYAANDGQKMFAVAGVALAAAHAGPLDLPVLLLLATVFAAGALTSVRRLARGNTFNLAPARPWQVVSAEVASSAAVFGTAGFGMPVSMTQSVAAGLVGAGASQGARRVRWQFAVPVLTSWLVTLPACFGAAALAGLLVTVLT
ncbi:inorganic phosphate transporter [Micromonospora sp. NPDC047074]|uniref:inorganic phosphate transporter n=1 Tax=Micromonospora sp. NPDC047074 TaxID=3154339 RepID=UPI0033F3366B